MRKFYRQMVEEKRKTLVEVITKYDIIVSSVELKSILETILPEGANIICSPYIEDPMSIYVIKKFDIMDYCSVKVGDIYE